jgi:TonB family protein
MPDWMKSLGMAVLLCLPVSQGICQDAPAPRTPRHKPGSASNPTSSLEHYLRGEEYFQQKNYQSAANEFREALNGNQEPKWTQVLSHNRLGDIFEATGQHDRALNEYRQAQRAGAPSVVAASELIQKLDPEYTEEARVAELEGTVVLSGAVGEDGFAHELQVVQALGLGLDENAMEAVKQWHFAPNLNPAQQLRLINVEFRLLTHQSRWHLIHVHFDAPAGTVRPVFASALYPIGAGLGPEAMEEGRLVAAMGRLATAKLTFEVDEHGLPVNFLQVPNSSEPIWGGEATALVGQWRFRPGMRNGIAVPVSCTVELVWGDRDLDFSKLAQVYHAMYYQTSASRDVPADSTAEPARIDTLRIKVDAHTQAGRLVIQPPPELTSAPGAIRLRGTVRLRVLIGIDGRVREAEAISGGDPGLTDAATEAVKQWVYLPTLLNGSPVEVTTQVDVNVGPSP